MRVLVTGMVAGMDDRAYLEKVAALGRRNHKDIHVFHAIDNFTKSGKKPLERLLGTTDYVFELTREREYERIGFEIQKHQYPHTIVRAPATIEWNRINRKFKDQKYIKEFINPDVIVTLIDAEWLIKEKLEKADGSDPFFTALRERNHTLYEILSWMHEEVSLSEDWAKYMGIPHYVIAVGEPPETLYKLTTDPEPWVVYASYSMTYATPEMRKEVDKVIHRLRDYAVIIDPQTVEIGTNYDNETQANREAIYAYTVHRDLHWYVGKVHAVVAIHPYPERPPLSAGMMDELGHARDYMKARYMIFPKGFSPFTTDSYIEKGHLFEQPDEFFHYIEHVEKRKKYSDDFTLQSDFL
ncbi:MAG: hypothetical protein ACFCUX_09455 [Candidatus Methylacidiphilales bacterium]